MRRAWWLGIGAAVAIAASGTLAYSLLGSGGPDYLWVDEVTAQSKPPSEGTISVRGKVAPGSISWDQDAGVATFSLAGERSRMEIVFEGVLPDGFAPGADLLVVGALESDGSMTALHLREPGTWCGACH